MLGSESWQDLFKPPSRPHEQKTPVLEKLGRFAFEIMPDELKDPAEYEKPERDPPKTSDEKANRYEQHCDGDHRNPNAVRQAVYRILV